MLRSVVMSSKVVLQMVHKKGHGRRHAVRVVWCLSSCQRLVAHYVHGGCCMWGGGGPGAEAFSDLVLPTTGNDRRCRGRLPRPCLRRAGHGPDAHTQALEVPTDSFTPAAIGEGGGTRGEPPTAIGDGGRVRKGAACSNQRGRRCKRGATCSDQRRRRHEEGAACATNVQGRSNQWEEQTHREKNR